ncbi:hypothetical protein LZ023_21930 [Pseudomonas silvicola]|nr:hypothetical protein LZ023_21930 [Pseudomonas silvicola]
MTTQQKKTQAPGDTVKWAIVNGNSFEADDIAFSHTGEWWELEAHTQRGNIGKSTGLYLAIKDASPQPLNGIFKIEDDLSIPLDKRDAWLFVLEEFAQDWYYAYTAAGQVEFKINPGGATTGTITARVEGVDLRGEFSVTQTVGAVPRARNFVISGGQHRVPSPGFKS